MLGYEGKASINEVDQVRQRKGSWPVWIDLQKEGIRGNIANNSSHSHSKYHIPYLLRNLFRKRRQHRRMPRTWTVGPHWGLWTFRRRCSLLPGNRVTIVELILKSSESMSQTVRWICKKIKCKKDFFQDRVDAERNVRAVGDYNSQQAKNISICPSSILSRNHS